jgi:hypothetical protein
MQTYSFSKPHGIILVIFCLHETPFQLGPVLQRIEAAVAPYPKAAMFELSDRGLCSLFEQLVSCIISIRTLDEQPFLFRCACLQLPERGGFVEANAAAIRNPAARQHLSRPKALTILARQKLP